MRAARRFTGTLIALGSLVITSAGADQTRNRVVQSGHRLKVLFTDMVNPDCSSRGLPQVNLIEAPQAGQVSLKNALDFPSLPQTDPSFHCDQRRVSGVQVFYQSRVGYVGADAFMIELVFPSGDLSRITYAMDVRSR